MDEWHDADTSTFGPRRSRLNSPLEYSIETHGHLTRLNASGSPLTLTDFEQVKAWDR
jgi:hypothetical protein